MKLSILALLILTGMAVPQNGSFKNTQLTHSRVKNAYKQFESTCREVVGTHPIRMPELQIYLRAFKQEEILELWGKNKDDSSFRRLKTFAFCSNSGTLGPKRKQGDYQIPEGFYHIDRFNPWSNYHLSLGINYPNATDLRNISESDPGGDIFIHGDCVTIGCIPITDDGIRELYIYCVEARNNGQKNIPVHIFPMRMAGDNYHELTSEYRRNDKMLAFWNNLKDGFDRFEKNNVLPAIHSSTDGYYHFR